MTHHHAGTARSRSTRRWAACVAALIGACLAASPRDLHAGVSLPSDIDVPAGHRLYLTAHAVGTQNYVCVTFPSPDGLVYSWIQFAPQATLFNDRDGQLITHFASPNPDEDGTARPTWQSSRDTSAVWAKMVAQTSDPIIVEPGAIPWLRLEVVGAERGPTGGRQLVETTYIQRVNTSGGILPTSGCEAPEHIGARAFVPYAADYRFYKAE